MDIPIPVIKEKRFEWIINVLSCLEPFKSLRPKEREVVARILKLSDELKSIPKEQRGLLIFHQDNKKRIAEEMEMTIDNYYNLILSLRKKGIVDEYGIVEKYSSYLLSDITSINFIFIEK